MKFFLVLSTVFNFALAVAFAQEPVLEGGALPASAQPLSPRRDVIRNPIQFRHDGFPVKESPFTDPILGEPELPSKQSQTPTQPSKDRGPSNTNYF